MLNIIKTGNNSVRFLETDKYNKALFDSVTFAVYEVSIRSQTGGTYVFIYPRNAELSRNANYYRGKSLVSQLKIDGVAAPTDVKALGAALEFLGAFKQAGGSAALSTAIEELRDEMDGKLDTLDLYNLVLPEDEVHWNLDAENFFFTALDSYWEFLGLTEITFEDETGLRFEGDVTIHSDAMEFHFTGETYFVFEDGFYPVFEEGLDLQADGPCYFNFADGCEIRSSAIMMEVEGDSALTFEGFLELNVGGFYPTITGNYKTYVEDGYTEFKAGTGYKLKSSGEMYFSAANTIEVNCGTDLYINAGGGGEFVFEAEVNIDVTDRLVIDAYQVLVTGDVLVDSLAYKGVGVPAFPAQDGEYKLKMTSGDATWVVDS
jgi:hypothetical protein